MDPGNHSIHKKKSGLLYNQFHKTPFFVIGNPRSGTSLLRLMLNSHPEICVPPECGFIEWWHEKYSGWSKKNIPEKGKVDEYVNDILSSKKMETWHIKKKNLKDNILFYKPGNYADLCAVVCLTFAQLKDKSGLKRWGDKNNYYIQKIDKLLSIFRDAQFILIIRDGRDVACSYRNIQKLETSSVYKPKLSYKIDEIAIEWLSNNQNVLTFFELLPVHQKHILKFESLVTDTKHELKKICMFLGLNFSGEMLDYFLHNRKGHDEPEEFIDWKKKTMEKPDPANSGKYKNELKPEEIKIFNSIAGEMLKRFNYKK
ncbi:MAG TPA: sulfotransferase [Bacteroidia bacterium]|nr:sulfotransferase [Bacteroidia bacterium]